MEKVNALGMVCPLPIIETKKAIAQLPAGGGVVQVLVDNAIACENLSKMSQQKGYSCSVNKLRDKEYAVTITVGSGHSVDAEIEMEQCLATGDGLVVAIGQDKMGGGDDDLGKILIKGFIFSLANLNVPPKAVLFFNSGVKLVIKGANTLDDLKTLKQKGTEILVCGTCVDFYNCKSGLAVGEITNMYNIVENLRLAKSVINI